MSRRDVLLGCAAVLSLGTVAAFAESGPHSPSPPAGGCAAFLTWYICSRRRKREIGGWLLYYYIQLYVGALATLGVSLASLENYRPSSWSSDQSLYPWFLLSTVPGVLVVPAQLVVAEILRKSRNPRFLQWLRIALWVDLGFALLGSAIDAAYFRDNLFLDVLPLVWVAIWLPYFYLSKRVRSVFITKDWFEPRVAVS